MQVLRSTRARQVLKIFKRRGVERIQIGSASAGDIVSIAGIAAGVTDTISDVSCTRGLETSPIDPPTLRMSIGVNRRAAPGRCCARALTQQSSESVVYSFTCSSPFVGKEGTIVNGTQIEEPSHLCRAHFHPRPRTACAFELPARFTKE